MKRGPSRVLVASLLLLGVTLATGCSHHDAPPSTAVRIRLRNFRVDMAPRVHAGLTRLEISSVGPTMHELVVAATELPADKLPLAANGTVDDEHPGFGLVSEAEGLDIGDHATLTLRLRPGHYVMFCNMQGHYQAGMATNVTVL